MSKKSELAKEIRLAEEDIRELELKRSRSLAALVGAIIDNSAPAEADVAYFKAFTAQIDSKRTHLQKLTKELEQIL